MTASTDVQPQQQMAEESSRKRERQHDESSDQEAEFEFDDAEPMQTEAAAASTSSSRTAAQQITPEKAKAEAAARAKEAAEVAKANETVFSPELLRTYYARLFPHELLTSWLAYDPAGAAAGTSNSLFARREWSFTIEPSPGDEIYIRYQSFVNPTDLTAAISKRNPHKIDIGAVFSHPPKDHNTLQSSGKFVTEQRELVFDIDLTDYDGVRSCGCAGAKICQRCWKMMTMAVKVMERGLREDFGFQHVAWFYSGRRGVHAWVCDESARTLSNEARSAVAAYFEVSWLVSLLAGEGMRVCVCVCVCVHLYGCVR
jgi:DNA primase small subunit